MCKSSPGLIQTSKPHDLFVEGSGAHTRKVSWLSSYPGTGKRKPKCRINSAGCMDRCDEGPLLVVYPEATWYTYVDKDDIDEILHEHIENGRIVKRLKI